LRKGVAKICPKTDDFLKFLLKTCEFPVNFCKFLPVFAPPFRKTCAFAPKTCAFARGFFRPITANRPKTLISPKIIAPKMRTFFLKSAASYRTFCPFRVSKFDFFS
jgi:hypothetical protein